MEISLNHVQYWELLRFSGLRNYTFQLLIEIKISGLTLSETANLCISSLLLRKLLFFKLG